MSHIVPLKKPKPRKTPDLLQLRIELAWDDLAQYRGPGINHAGQMAFNWGGYHRNRPAIPP